MTEADITTVVNIPVGRDKGTNGQVTVNFVVSSQIYIFGVHLNRLIYNQTCIQRPLKGTWKCGLYEQFPFIYMLKLYALFINGKNEIALYRQWFVI